MQRDSIEDNDNQDFLRSEPIHEEDGKQSPDQKRSLYKPKDSQLPEISLIQMKNSNEITNSIQFGNMRVSSEIRKKPDEMFLSKDESFFKDISANKNPLILDHIFEKKKKEVIEEVPINNDISSEMKGKINDIQEEKENEVTDDESSNKKNNLDRLDFGFFDKKKSGQKDQENINFIDQESTKITNLEQESDRVNNFETIELNPHTQEQELTVPSSGNFTKRKSGFHPDNHPRSMNDQLNGNEIELTTKTNNKSNFSIDKMKPKQMLKTGPNMNIASITSLGTSSHIKKDFTKDKMLIKKGYSMNLLNAMNEYSMVLDHIKAVRKNQVDPYKNVKSIFELKNIHKTYLVGMEGVPALRGIDLKIYDGEFLMIYGKSGGGKSSLLNLIGTIDEPNKGSIHMEGQGFLDCLKDNQLSKIRLSNIGFVFQSFNLINSLTALENIKLPMLLKGEISAKDAHKRAISLMEELSILHRKDAYPKQMSGGEQQRVTIARAVANKPKMLLLDEPTGDLDSKNSLIVMRILLELNIKEKITMIMVTHDEHIKDLANRIVYVIDGKINKCVVNPKNQRRKVIDKLLRDAEEVRREIKELKLKDAQGREELVKVKKVYRNPIQHPFFRHLARKARG
jgi:putative ABC transport system ATP-binding protein